MVSTIDKWRWRRLLVQKFVGNQLPAEHVGNDVRLMAGKLRVVWMMMLGNYGGREVWKRSFRGRSPAGWRGRVDSSEQRWRRLSAVPLRQCRPPTMPLAAVTILSLIVIHWCSAVLLSRSSRRTLSTPWRRCRWHGCRFCLERNFRVHIITHIFSLSATMPSWPRPRLGPRWPVTMATRYLQFPVMVHGSWLCTFTITVCRHGWSAQHQGQWYGPRLWSYDRTEVCDQYQQVLVFYK